MVQLEGRHGFELSKDDNWPGGGPIAVRGVAAAMTAAVAQGGAGGRRQSASALMAGRGVGAASSMAWEPCVEEGLVLMEHEVCVCTRQYSTKAKIVDVI